MTDIKYMYRCLQLAALGNGQVAPNPMVGAVIVRKDKIVAEGYHQRYGGRHAEVEAIQRLSITHHMDECTLYVNLEPCSHHGKTPPCADLIIQTGIKHVVVAALDPNPAVCGQGVERMQQAGIRVEVGLLTQEAILLNQSFYTYHQKKRPHIYFKWAQTLDGFIDRIRQSPSTASQISGPIEAIAVHRWRAQYQAIMVGTQTVLMDNPSLTVRMWEGKHPLRITFDRNKRLHNSLNLFDGKVPTLLFVPHADLFRQKEFPHTELIGIDFDHHFIDQLMRVLYNKHIQSLMIEGGARLIHSFIDQNMWDNADVLLANICLGEGIVAPKINSVPKRIGRLGSCQLLSYTNQ